MQGDVIEQGVQLMLFGMGTVLLFLSVLVLATLLMSYVLNRFFPSQLAAVPPQAGRVDGEAGVADARHIAAISAAIHRYRREHR